MFLEILIKEFLMFKNYYFSNNCTCPICEHIANPFDVVDFNKTAVERKGIFLEKSGKPVYYNYCDNCGFLFAPEFQRWSDNDFEKYIYNEDYEKIDPDYLKRRPIANGNFLIKTFKNTQEINHLDFGGGNGLCSEYLKQKGWKSTSYDPYSKKNEVNLNEKYNLITAFEVFEHHNNPHKLIEDLLLLLEDDGIIVFSTLLSDEYLKKNQRINWWYVSPRNGHISIFSRKSLNILCEKYKFRFGSFHDGVHILFREKLPKWSNFKFV